MIMLKDIWPWPVDKQKEYKVHLAQKSGRTGFEPLDVWVESADKWRACQEDTFSKDVFNRPYIFALMDCYHQANAGLWLFGGIFKVLHRTHNPGKVHYDVELTEFGQDFIGRLKIHSPYKSRQTYLKMEGLYDGFEVREILPERYSGQTFPGFRKINLPFAELAGLIKKDKLDWKAALENVKGIYLLTDKKSNKRYVGAAYGEDGVWKRWGEYANGDGGGNKGMKALLKDKDPNYFRENFQIALLEHWPFNTSDDEIIARENHWKEVLRSRVEEGGLNRN